VHCESVVQEPFNSRSVFNPEDIEECDLPSSDSLTLSWVDSDAHRIIRSVTDLFDFYRQRCTKTWPSCHAGGLWRPAVPAERARRAGRAAAHRAALRRRRAAVARERRRGARGGGRRGGGGGAERALGHAGRLRLRRGGQGVAAPGVVQSVSQLCGESGGGAGGAFADGCRSAQVIADQHRNVFVYWRAAAAAGAELRNRRAGGDSQRVPLARQSLIALDAAQHILGLMALDRVLFVLTDTQLHAFVLLAAPETH